MASYNSLREFIPTPTTKGRLIQFIFLTIILIHFSCGSEPKEGTEIAESTCNDQGMVVTAHPLASKVGVSILRLGGNAFDAAIATQFALAVVYPRAGNIGGGGFMVYREADGKSGALNFRERSSINAYRDMYLDENGDVIKNASTLGHLSVAVPGVVDGMIKIHERYGSMEWKDLIQPSINLALNGFSLTKAEADKLNDHQVIFSLMNGADMPFLRANGKWNEGDSIRLTGLSETLIRIKHLGRDGFYQGETARLMLDEIKSGQGIIEQRDLDNYSAEWMESLDGSYKGHKVISMPLPSSGGITVQQLLIGVEEYDIARMGHNSASAIHIMTELERRAYADRASHLGDADFHDVPLAMLLDKNYLRERNASINLTRKTDSDEIKKGKVEMIESHETTHFSIIDKEGNAIALTTTLNGNYGSKVMVDGAQFFLNNEMDDFSVKPGVPNMYGLLGNEANSIAPEKRMLSSMSPTILEKDGRPFMILGTPGGSTIITSVFQNILNVIDHGMTLEESVNAGRVHHQWLPDRILFENGRLDYDVIEKLESLGHKMEGRPSIGRVDAILIENDCYIGVADSRGDDKAEGF